MPPGKLLLLERGYRPIQDEPQAILLPGNMLQKMDGCHHPRTLYIRHGNRFTGVQSRQVREHIICPASVGKMAGVLYSFACQFKHTLCLQPAVQVFLNKRIIIQGWVQPVNPVNLFRLPW